MVWFSYVYEIDYQRQRGIIKHLVPYLKHWLELGLIKGFNYNHFAGKPDEPDHISVRLDISDSKSEGEIELILKSLGTPKKQEYEPAAATVKYGYEFGSKCAVSILNSIESGRIHEDLLKDPDFWISVIHGTVNSSGMVELEKEDAQRLLKDYCQKLRRGW